MHSMRNRLLQTLLKIPIRLSLLVFLVIGASAGFSKGQGNPEEEKIHVIVDQMPQYPGGQKAMLQYLKDNFQPPAEFFQQGISGMMTATFVVTKEGKVERVEVVKKLSPGLDAELQRIVASMPNWKPGIHNGTPVALQISVPYKVVFTGIKGEDASKVALASVLNNAFGENRDPEFPGGENLMWAYLKENQVSLDDARKVAEDGFLLVSFLVTEKGEIQDISLSKSLEPGFDQKLVEVLAKMPAWKPATSRGKPVAVTYSFSYAVSEQAEQAALEVQRSLEGSKLYNHVDEMPEFPGGEKAMLQFMAENFIIPAKVKRGSTVGTIVLSFVVDKSGKVGNVEVLKKLEPNLDQEAVRVIKTMPAWKPGRLKGKEVDVKFTMPYRIILNQ